MFRKIEAELENWKADKNKKALLVTGARQIGKTYAIRQLGKTYQCFVEINFITQPDAISIFDGALDADTIILNLTAFTGQALIPRETLIFLDEIQECPNARTAIKFLVEDGRFDYVESGSLLGVNYKTVKSYPVGFEHTITMYPMDFEEFCIANSVQNATFSYLKDCFNRKVQVSEAVHATLLKLFTYYTVTGGMPEAVQRFIDTHDMQQVIDIQEDILAAYRQDIGRYANLGKARIQQIFDHIPSQLDDKNRRFKMSALSKNARSREYEDAFVWLKDAGVALPCYNVSEPKVPLKLNEQSTTLKLYISDCGLLCAASMERVQSAILNGDLSINMGSILENVFAQQFVSEGFQLRYYNKHNVGEVDFVIQNGNAIVPIEIKSGNDYKRHKALDNMLSVSEWNIEKSIVFSKGNVETDGKITYLPWYMMMFYTRTDALQDFTYEVDLSVLK